MSEDRDVDLLTETEGETREDITETLIECVRSRPVLYDYTHRDYKNSIIKEVKWSEVAEEVKKDVEWCKAKWKYVRDNYQRKKKALKGKSGDAAKKIKKWCYFELLSFLATIVEEAETLGNVDQIPTSEEKEEGRTPLSRPFKRKQAAEAPSAVDQALIKYMEKETDSKDCYHYFGLSVASQLRGLSKIAASFAMTKIQHVLLEVESSASRPTPQMSNANNDVKQ